MNMTCSTRHLSETQLRVKMAFNLLNAVYFSLTYAEIRRNQEINFVWIDFAKLKLHTFILLISKNGMVKVLRMGFVSSKTTR